MWNAFEQKVHPATYILEENKNKEGFPIKLVLSAYSNCLFCWKQDKCGEFDKW